MTKTKDKIYQTFFITKKDKLYYNELKEHTNLSHSSLQNILNKFLENKEIILEKTKSNTYYKLTNKSKAIEFTKIILNLIENLNIDVKIPIKELMQKTPKTIHTILLFGSASIKQENENSDIDLLIILNNFENKELQKSYEKEIKNKIKQIKKEIEIKSIYPLSIAYTTKNEFEKQEDFLIKEAKLNGFPLINQLNYLQQKR